MTSAAILDAGRSQTPTLWGEGMDSAPRAGLPAWPRLPYHAPGMAIGLYGGSFNPPHAAHRLLGREAMRRLGLQRVWCLVTPGNPLKSRGELAPFVDRYRAVEAVARHPRIDVTDVEVMAGLRYSRDTVRYLRARAPGVRFVWIMGADNLAGFHRWQGWREIAAAMPMAVFDRPGFTLRALASRAAQAMAPYRIEESDAGRLAFMAPPAWTFIHQQRSSLSSTAIRATILKMSPSDA